jgi:hypothetical protein
MFFQSGTPDTSGYMIAGYAVAFIVMALYVASIYLRSRNLKQDMEMLREMEEPAPAVKVSPPKQNSSKPVTK